MSASVSIDRTSLELPPLVISDSSTEYRLTEEGLGRPGVTWRVKNMPDSDDIHGSERIAAAKEETSIPLEFNVLGATSAAIEASIDALDEALSQWAYPVTRTVDGVSKTWGAGPADWGPSGHTDAYDVAAGIEVIKAVIPVYPIAS